ncbi:hypothetical protein ABZ502_30100 [Streptomyces abikoensis]|uniref:hypothetical protein n=1 Tax=Streptomyces abikoensis TaxID=97398 RepID=UPI0033CFEF79
MVRPVSVKQSVVDDGRGTYCSTACRGVSMRNGVTKTCPQCGALYTIPASLKDKRRACSQACWWKMMGIDPGRSAILARARHDLLTTRTRPAPSASSTPSSTS